MGILKIPLLFSSGQGEDEFPASQGPASANGWLLHVVVCNALNSSKKLTFPLTLLEQKFLKFWNPHEILCTWQKFQ